MILGPFQLPICTQSRCSGPTSRGGVCREERWKYLKIWVCGTVVLVRCARHAPNKVKA
jgi:hypothetical protein